VNLYREDAMDASATHMKHPADELYTALLPAMEARGATGFADELEALAVAVEQKQGAEAVEAAYAALLDAIGKAEAAVKEPDAGTLVTVIVDLVRTAAAEYDIAVGEGGVLENEHEYQDALGFVRTANEWMPKLAALTDNDAAVMAIQTQLDMLLPIWPGLKAPARLETAPSVIYGAAARIEFAGLKV
jgi:DNA-binding GntR family transcriptional regulator